MTQGIKTVYFAGELFSAKHLAGNALLAEAITHLSKGQYNLLLPQNFEKRDRTHQSIRDEDLKTITASDAILVNYDGTELDSGTVVEYLFAKFADIPAVILRTDFRGESDQKTFFPWNLMTSFFPRTEVVLLNSQSVYQEALLTKSSPSQCIQALSQKIAYDVIHALNKVLATPPLMPEELKPNVHEWLNLFPGYSSSLVPSS